MNVRIASVSNGLSVRRIVALDIFRWSLRLGFAIAPRDVRNKHHRSRKLHPPSLAPRLREDIGLPPLPEPFSHDVAIRLMHCK